MVTDGDLMKFAVDGSENERNLALTIMEDRGRLYAKWRELIDALHRIEALEKEIAQLKVERVVVDQKPLTFPSVGTIPPAGCTCGRPWWGTVAPPPCPVHGPAPTWKIVCTGSDSNG